MRGNLDDGLEPILVPVLLLDQVLLLECGLVNQTALFIHVLVEGTVIGEFHRCATGRDGIHDAEHGGDG